MTDEEHLEAIDELATVFNEDQDVQDLLDRISFPVPRRPVFYPDPRAFWRRVYRDVQNGMTAGGPEALLREAFRLRPHNAFFGRFSDSGAPVVQLENRPADEPQVDITKLPVTGAEFVGRADELARLDAAWDDPSANVISFVAFGGVGKSALVNKWLDHLAAEITR